MSPDTYDEQVNFLPEWYIQDRMHRRKVCRYIVLVAMMVVGMGILWSMTNHRYSEMKNYYASLQSEIVEAKGKITEVDKLQAARSELSQQIRIYKKLVLPVTYSQIVGTLSVLMPNEISLSELYVHNESLTKVDHRAKSDGVVQKSKKKKYPAVVLEMEGNAPSNVVIANFVGKLAGSDFYRNVKMVFSTEGRVGDSITRQFRITMEVPLDVEYRNIGMEEEVANAY